MKMTFYFKAETCESMSEEAYNSLCEERFIELRNDTCFFKDNWLKKFNIYEVFLWTDKEKKEKIQEFQKFCLEFAQKEMSRDGWEKHEVNC